MLTGTVLTRTESFFIYGKGLVPFALPETGQTLLMVPRCERKMASK